MTAQRTKLQEFNYFLLLRLLKDNPEMSQRELAKEVRVGADVIHYVLSALPDKGLLKLGKFTSAQDEMRHAYELAAKGLSATVALG